MSAKEVIKRVLRIRRKLFDLAGAKENALRELAGYPPLQTWWESCYGGFMSVVRVTCCRAFCPCCLIRWRFKAIFCPRTRCWGRCFYEGDYENEVLKNILGFLFGSVLTVLLYAWLSLSKDYPMFQAAIVSCVFGVVLTIGMAFAPTVRCLVFLTIPSMFSKKGRNFLLLYATVLVFSHPAANIAANLKVVADSSTCGQSLMMNETKKLLAFAGDPLSAIADALQTMYDHIKAFANLLVNGFKALIRAITEIMRTIKAVFEWLWSLVDICNEKMGEPYRKCMRSFDDAYEDCCDRLGIFKFICKIVSAASSLCHLARIGELLCVIVGAVKELIVDKVKAATIGSINDLKEMFWFEINITRRYTYNITQSRSYTEVKDAIMAEVTAAVSGYSNMLAVVDNVMMITVFYVFYKSWRYRRGYLTKDSYDNYYITQQIYAIDERRAKMGKDRVFPMRASEELKYIPLYSHQLTKKEARKMSKGVFIWMLAAYNGFYHLTMDYSLYWLLGMIARHLNVKTTAALPPFMQLHVNGQGPLSDMYRTMVGLLDPLAEGGMDVDSSSCLPIPSRPDFRVYRIIITLYFLCLFLSVGEAYGLRMRRAVAACYYPQREQQRAVWLYNQILYKRMSFMRFTRRQVRRKYMDEKEIEKMSIRGRLARTFPKTLGRLVKMCGYDFKNCLSCGQEGRPKDLERFTHCSNYGCNAVYCNECYIELNSLCTVCMNPVDYGDLSDASEEIDSSEDEDIVAFKKRQAKEKRRKLEEKRKKQKPQTALTRFMDLAELPESKTELMKMQQGEDSQPLLGKEAKGKSPSKGNKNVNYYEQGDADLNNSEAAASSSDISSSESESKKEKIEYDQSYQYANKSDITTSPAEETPESDSDTEAWRNSNVNRYAAIKKPVEYETLDIFNVSLSDNNNISTDDDTPESVVVGSGGDSTSGIQTGYHPGYVTSQSADSDQSPLLV